ncbi:MAG: zinc dependent phospholipase C family protein [Gemmatimonadota bacterium]
MTRSRILAALAVVVLIALVLPEQAHAWTPGTHIYLGESVLQNLRWLPLSIADLLRAFPCDFLYGNIAADTSVAKKYAPVGRHSHAWHVGQEVHDLAGTPALRAFSLGYLCHLAADTVAHNYYVPHQLMLTSSTSGMGHSYWESRIETVVGDKFARAAKDLIQLDHEESDRHLDRIISPTLFSVATNRRLFRGMVHLTDTPGWQLAFQVVHETSRWELTSPFVERHLAHAYESMMELLAGENAMARRLDPSGEVPLASAKRMRRLVLREAGKARRHHLATLAAEHYGLPERTLRFWERAELEKPWRNGGNDGSGGNDRGGGIR